MRRLIDRRGDRYVEQLVEPHTERLTRHVSEPLSQHWRHGDAKPPPYRRRQAPRSQAFSSGRLPASRVVAGFVDRYPQEQILELTCLGPDAPRPKCPTGAPKGPTSTRPRYDGRFRALDAEQLAKGFDGDVVWINGPRRALMNSITGLVFEEAKISMVGAIPRVNWGSVRLPDLDAK